MYTEGYEPLIPTSDDTDFFPPCEAMVMTVDMTLLFQI